MATQNEAVKGKAVKRANGRRQRGYTLLEYCAGAAVVAGVLWGALDSMGKNLAKFNEGISQWATAQKEYLDTKRPTTN